VYLLVSGNCDATYTTEVHHCDMRSSTSIGSPGVYAMAPAGGGGCGTAFTSSEYIQVHLQGSDCCGGVLVNPYGVSTTTPPSGIVVATDGSLTNTDVIPYFVIYGLSGPPIGGGGFVDTRTRIVVTNPENATTTATTTTVGATVYVNPDQYESGMYLNIALTNQAVQYLGGSALDAWNAATGNNGFRIPITASGTVTVGTTTTFSMNGLVHATWSIRKDTFASGLPLLGVLFSPDTYAATSTVFTVGYATPLDQAIAAGAAGFASYTLTGATSTLPFSLDCNILHDFSIQACVVSLFVPSHDDLNATINQAQTMLLQKWPWGYVTRFATILTTSSTSTLPTLNVALPSGLPGGGQSVNLTPWDELTTGTSMLATAQAAGSNPQIIRQVFEPGWDFLVYFLFAGAVFMRIPKLKPPHKSVTSSKNV